MADVDNPGTGIDWRARFREAGLYETEIINGHVVWKYPYHSLLTWGYQRQWAKNNPVVTVRRGLTTRFYPSISDPVSGDSHRGNRVPR
jgi:hypothetical protein